MSDFIYAPEKIAENIQPLPPITLRFSLHLAKSPPEPTIYDVPVLLDDPLDVFTAYFRAATWTSTHSPTNQDFMSRLKQISLIDRDIALAVQAMYASKGKIGFLRDLQENPVDFIKKWVASQQADEAIILAEERARGEEWRKGGSDGLWGSDGAREGVGLLLAKKGPM